MIEYEYSQKVKSIEPFIKYCIDNDYEKEFENYQIRKLYTSPNKILARLTTIEDNSKSSTVLDFKDEDDSDKILKASRETIPLEVTKENEESIMSIFNILDYKLSKTLKRNRVVYTKGNVKFEMDNYIEPETFCVLAIEGFKEEVDKVYMELESTIKEETF